MDGKRSKNNQIHQTLVPHYSVVLSLNSSQALGRFWGRTVSSLVLQFLHSHSHKFYAMLPVF